MSDSQVLQTCVTKKVSKLPKNCFDILIKETTSMTYGKFKRVSEAMAAGMPVFNDEKEAEDGFWQTLASANDMPYAINVPTSLFGNDTIVWNLNNFTRSDSNIHSTPSHQLLKVQIHHS